MKTPDNKIEKLLQETGVSSRDAERTAEEIHRADRLLQQMDEPHLPPKTRADIEQAIRANLSSVPSRTITFYARRLVPVAAAIMIAFLVIWQGWNRQHLIEEQIVQSARNELAPFADEMVLWDLALKQNDIDEETIDVLALIEVLPLWDNTEEQQDNILGKEHNYENFINPNYYRTYSCVA
ncbi:MAG: hypothetical protein KAJ46_01360 [Sedimentisphaerales bacterium]|nr:hypothetical protein [Sedimentisphaerales bacterium]